MALENITKQKEPKRMSSFKKTVLVAVVAGSVGAVAAGYSLVSSMSESSSKFAKGSIEMKANIYNGLYKGNSK